MLDIRVYTVLSAVEVKVYNVTRTAETGRQEPEWRFIAGEAEQLDQAEPATQVSNMVLKCLMALHNEPQGLVGLIDF